MDTIKRISLNSWSSLRDSFDYLWGKLSGVLPSLVIAIVVLVIGSWVAVFVGNKVADLIKKGKIDSLLERTILFPLDKVLGIKINSAKFIGEFVKWLLLVTVFISVFYLAGMPRVVSFFDQVLSYARNVFVAAFIVVVGTMLAGFVASLVTIVTKGEHEYMASGTKLAINLFAFIAALHQILTPLAGAWNQLMLHLGITGLKSDALFIGIVVLLVLAFKEIVVTSVKDLYDEVKRARGKKGSRLDEIVKLS